MVDCPVHNGNSQGGSQGGSDGVCGCKIHRDRKGSFGFPEVPKDFAEKLKVTNDVRPFLVYSRGVTDNHASPKMLLFMSEHAASRMSSVNIWFLDCTFKSRPKPFKQVCTNIRVFFGSVCVGLELILSKYCRYEHFFFYVMGQ